MIERYEMHCTYSPQLPVSDEVMDSTLLRLRDQGLIKHMLNDI